MEWVKNTLLEYSLMLAYLTLAYIALSILGMWICKVRTLKPYALSPIFGVCASVLFVGAYFVLSLPLWISTTIGAVCAFFSFDVYRYIKQALSTKPRPSTHYEVLWSKLGEAIFPFSNEIECRISNDGKSYTLLSSFYYARADENLEPIIVPKGFESDGFTNFGLHTIVPQYGKGLKCAILHDYLCEEFHKGKITREQADRVFLESMLETKAFAKWRIYAVYVGVRLFARVKGYK